MGVGGGCSVSAQDLEGWMHSGFGRKCGQRRMRTLLERGLDHYGEVERSLPLLSFVSAACGKATSSADTTATGACFFAAKEVERKPAVLVLRLRRLREGDEQRRNHLYGGLVQCCDVERKLAVVVLRLRRLREGEEQRRHHGL